jgi:hypothetical protein
VPSDVRAPLTAVPVLDTGPFALRADALEIQLMLADY